MIKKYVLGFLVVLGIGFIGFSSSDFTTRPFGGYSASVYDLGSEIAVYSRGNLSSQRLGTVRRMLTFISTDGARTYFFWNNLNFGYPYMYNYVRDGGNASPIFRQGTPIYYNLCPEIESGLTGIDFSQCTKETIDDSFVETVKPFFNSLTSSDYYSYEWLRYHATIRYYSLSVCFSSHSFNKSICFFSNQGLTGSLDLSGNISFGSIPNTYLGDPPGRSTAGGGSSIDGSSSQGSFVEFTGNVMYSTCTNGYVIQQLEQFSTNMADWMCNAGTFDTGLVTNDYGGVPYSSTGISYKDLFTLTSDGMGWRTWFRSYEDEMIRYKYGQVSVNPFLSRPIALYNYFERLYNHGYLGYGNDADGPDGIGPNFIYNYCALKLYSDYSADYKGSFFSSVCDGLSSGGGGGGSGGGGGGCVGDACLEGTGGNTNNNQNVGVSWNGVLSGNTDQNFEGRTFINDFYQKLQANFQKPVGSLFGIVPNFIIVFMLALILFRFLQH